MTAQQQQRGTVQWFDAKKGFGFIRPEDGDSDLFVHHTNILMDGYRKLDEGQRVQFEVEHDGRRGDKAVLVTPI